MVHGTGENRRSISLIELPFSLGMDIKAIDKSTVHRICSGQVVLTLAVAVKELVENSIDAGATSVEVKLKESGLSMIEVTDNGSGVTENNFEGLALKHHTSKITNFEDLDCGVTTFGFRGEALSSLCALSHLTVITRHKDSDVGYKIDYDKNGKIQNTTKCARPVGTTVQLRDLFHTLPVRYKEFQRNIRREYQKLIKMMSAYCLISTGVKLTFTNTTVDGKKTVLLSTKGSPDIKENIAAVFGTKQLTTLEQFRLVPPMPDCLEDFNIRSPPDHQPFTFNGFISTCQYGTGRGSVDRQFLFINGRPCEMDKLTRVINEVYHLHSKNQYPIVVLNIIVDKGTVDVNLTPDKRKILLDYEAYLLATVKLQEASVSSKRKSSIFEYIQESQAAKKRTSLDHYFTPKTDDFPDANHQSDIDDEMADASPSDMQPFTNQRTLNEQTTDSESKFSSTIGNHMLTNSCASKKVEEQTVKDVLVTGGSSNATESYPGITGSNLTFEPISQDCLPTCEDEQTIVREKIDLNMVTSPKPAALLDFKEQEEVGETCPSHIYRKEFVVHFSLLSLKEKLAAQSKQNDDSITCPKFRCKIKPEANKEAESELQQNIRKCDFKDMEVLGQFNLGFIITKLKSDLFIVDQHATDEKYNFEMLQKHTVMKRQKLIQPKPLQLSSDNEILLMDNLEIFDKNGFEFEISQSAEPTQRVGLSAQPVSHNWTFGKNDIDELLYLIREFPDRFHRPSRVRDMFASKACRKSVMIGKALKQKDMKMLLAHMSQIEQPWNCPHGRPTMRHLVNLSLLVDLTSEVLTKH